MQESLESSLVRIHTTDGRVVGAGFLVGERHILTCAHVVSQALDLASSPVDPPPGVVSLDFPHIPPHTLLTAGVVLWCPPLHDGSGDLAGLELEREPPTGAQKVRFASSEDVWKHDFSALGFPEDFDDGVWATGRLLRRQATNWIQIEDVKAQGFAVGPGFSGTPVWDEQLQGVVGMVVAASRPADTRTAFVIPLEVLAAAWPLLVVHEDQPRNPYKGLRPFTQRDAADFFGREVVIEKVVELVNLLVAEQPASSSTRLLTILGPSGVGKSSLVMAGLLPQLQQGALPGSKEWVYLDHVVPGKHPLEALASTLKPHFPDTSFKTLREDLEDEGARCMHLLATQLAKQPGTKVVLLIDQCEELFTQTESEDERQCFIRLLLNACKEPRGPVVVVLTLRADFYDRPMQYPELFRLIELQHLSLLAIEPDDLRRVIEQPATLSDVQVTFEDDLVNRLLFEVQGQVGALPLLQFTLDQLFQRRSGRQLTFSAYRELGGVKGALTRQAEEIYVALPSEEHHMLARALFMRLIDPGASEQDTTRRRATLSEFSLPETTRTRLLRETIDAFIATRLLTTNEIAGTTTIEVSHEALIREWPRLAGWLREAREDIRLQQAISQDVAKWERHGKSRDRLYRGSQLKESRAWAKRNTPSGNEVAFLRAGAASRVRFLVSVITVLLIVVSSMGGASWILTHQPPKSPDPTRVSNTQDNNNPGSLRYAVDKAPSGSTIRIDASLRGTILLANGVLNIVRNLKILGPGAGKLSIESPKNEQIDHIVHVLQGVSVTISGLTFTDSHIPYGFIDGGGINNEGKLILSDSIVSDNTATDGGGIFNSGTLTLTNSTVSGNTALADGGGIFNEGGMLTLINSTVSGNETIRGFGGGGIFNNGELILINSTVSGNKSIGPNNDGGGIFNEIGMLTLINSTISGNTALTDGGGIFIQSYVYGRAYIAHVDLTFSTMYGNTAHGGGDIAIEDVALSSIGGRSKAIKQHSQVKISNSIVASSPADPGSDIEGMLTSYGYNLFQDTYGATFDRVTSRQHGTDKTFPANNMVRLFADPVGLRNNGGLTKTFALASGSPAIDAVPLDACHMTVPIMDALGTPISQYTIITDQRGMKRPDGNEPACDIGAYEYVDSPI